MNERKKWSEEEIKILVEMFPNTHTKVICKMLSKPYHSVANKAYSMKIKKSEDFTKEFLAESKKRLREISEKNQFKKGNIPFNKGKKMSNHTYEKCKATMFKKGNLPHNAKNDWEEVFRRQKDGTMIIMIKVPEHRELVYKHVWIWEKENGKVPKGFNVVFKDNNKLNCTIENLECISNAELMQRNSIHRFPLELKKTIMLFHKVKKTILKLKHAKKQN